MESDAPSGVPALEDKIVQSGVTEVLSAIYEADGALIWRHATSGGQPPIHGSGIPRRAER